MNNRNGSSPHETLLAAMRAIAVRASLYAEYRRDDRPQAQIDHMHALMLAAVGEYDACQRTSLRDDF